MPSPHFDAKIISRKEGQSGVASASYRSGEKLHDERVNKTFDYSRKDDVLHSEILAPEGAPDWVHNRSELWNEVEAGEKRKDAQIARHIVAGLARELIPQQQIEQVREYAKNFTSAGMIVDYSIHESTAGDGGKNPHVHIALTMRDVSQDGFGNKNREWNKKDLVEQWRDSWEKVTNKHLENAGRDERVSLKSLKEQGIDKKPEIHMGVAAFNMEQKGAETQKGNINREKRHNNAVNERVRVNTGRNVDRHHLNRGHSIERAFNQVPQEVRNRLNEVRDRVTEQHQERQELRDGMQPRQEPETQNPQRSQELEREQHSRTLAEYLKNTTLQTVQNHVEFIRNYGQAAIEKTVQVGRNIFDEYASMVEKTETEKEQQPERNQEQSVVEKIIDAGRSIFDKYASLAEKTKTEQERSRERERDRDYER